MGLYGEWIRKGHFNRKNVLINYLCNVLKLCFYTINITVDTQFIALDTSNGATREKLFCCLDTYGIVTLPYKPLYAIVTIVAVV